MSSWRILDDVPQKRCATCAARGREEWHDYAAFAKDKRRKNGLCIRCKLCMHEDFSAWRDANPEKYAAHIEANIERDKAMPEAARERWRRAYQKNRTPRQKEKSANRGRKPKEKSANRGRKPIEINGTLYPSQSAAARAHGVSPSTISKRLARAKERS